MRLATWNLKQAVAPKRKMHELWAWMESNINPDVVVLTEAKEPDTGIPDGWTAVWQAGGIGPKVLLGIYGRNIKHRFVAGAAEIDAEHWLDDDLRSPRSGRWKVPILDRTNIDACELRGVRVKEVRFTNFTSGLFIWVDGSGRVRHPQ
jgi:hypothetical protein